MREVKKKIFEFFRPIIKSPEVKAKASQVLEQEYKYFFENPQLWQGYEGDNPLYQIFINNNLPYDNGLIWSSKF